MKKNIFDRFQENLVKQVEEFEKREDKNILKKIPFWMIFFFPYGLYLFLFKTKVKKRFKVIVGTIFALIIILFIDIAVYPNRVYDNVAKETYEQFISENTDLKLDKPSYVSKSSHFNINNEMYFSFNIYDSLNMYYGIFKVHDYNKNYEIVSLYDIDYNFSNIYSSSEFSCLKDIHPVILNWIFLNNDNISFSDISKVTDVKEDDLFENLIYQDIKVKDKVYSFKFNDFAIVSVTDVKSNEELYSTSFNNSLKPYLPQVVSGLLQKNFNSSYEIVGYNYFNSKHYYNINVAGKEYSVEYLPGVNATLLSITDKEEFISHLESLIRK